ncbi:diguanylate cyclase (GGDEF) domain-containing protein [Klenkia soli]|uniref:Diguanylate cyclase (GGDEF) domain-containing protein n=1 Tax=Klenkia soli TaxID=1052260 RepID=A0A1H0HVU2_9ACTN|nr:EAL domain-containing protein [Klenkia soli]SDO23277.1 diguanylate cyclase (GGDEF) domain-containing protein [Klenkia soli]
MDRTRRWTPFAGLAYLTLLGGAALLPPGQRRLASDAVVVVAAVVTAVVVARAGRRTCARARGWHLVSLSLVAGVVLASSAELLSAVHGPVDPPRTAASVLPHLLGAVAVLTLLGRSRLRAGGARLLVESALFCTAAFVLAQLLVVGPLVRDLVLSGPARAALEASCLAATLLLGSGLTFVTAAGPARRTTGGVTLAGLAAVAVADCLSVLGSAGPFGLLGTGSRALYLVGLVLLCLAAQQDPGDGPAERAPGRRLTHGITLAGQLLPHGVMVLAAVLLLGSALFMATPTAAALVAVALGLLLTGVHRVVVVGDEMRYAGGLARSEAWFRRVVRASSDAVLVLDDDRAVTWAASVLADPAEAAGRPLLGVPLVDRVHPQDVETVRAWLGDADGPEVALDGLCSFRLPAEDGSWRVWEAGVTDLRADAAVGALVLHCRDVTVRLHAEDELRSLAFTDPATGLPNRAAHVIALAEELAAADDAPQVALLLFEVEGLDEARENVGRDVVELSVVEIGRRLRATVRGDDLVARVGPEVFAVLAHGEGDEPDRVAARCLSVVEQPVVTPLGLVDLSAAVGLVPLVGGLGPETVLDRAELAVREARRSGTGSVRRYDPALGAVRDRRERLRADLVGARARGELGLVWQPIVSLAEQRVTGVEALVRWNHPVFGELEPEEFIPVAERAGLVGDVQRWVLHEALLAAAALPEHGAPLRLGINVSAVHLASGTVVGDVSSALRAAGFPAQRLVVEVAGSTTLLEDPSVASDFAALRLMGVHLALDDFGAPSSTLDHLTRLPVDVVKLDRTFLARVDKEKQTRALCASVIGIGGDLGIDVVAEGVETPSQLTVLRTLGCGFAQGFLLSRPLTLPALVACLDAGGGHLWPGQVGRVDVARADAG